MDMKPLRTEPGGTAPRYPAIRRPRSLGGQRGLTLIELLVAVTLGAWILGLLLMVLMQQMAVEKRTRRTLDGWESVERLLRLLDADADQGLLAPFGNALIRPVAADPGGDAWSGELRLLRPVLRDRDRDGHNETPEPWCWVRYRVVVADAEGGTSGQGGARARRFSLRRATRAAPRPDRGWPEGADGWEELEAWNTATPPLTGDEAAVWRPAFRVDHKSLRIRLAFFPGPAVADGQATERFWAFEPLAPDDDWEGGEEATAAE